MLQNQIDYVLINSKWAQLITKAHSVWNAPIDSDHAPVSVALQLRFLPKTPTIAHEKRLNVSLLHTNIQMLQDYQQTVICRTSELTNSGRETPNFEIITKAVLMSAKETIPELPSTNKKPFLSLEAEHLAAKVGKLRRVKGTEANRAKRALRRQLRKDDEQLWTERASELEDAMKAGNTKKTFALLRFYSGKTKRAPDCLKAENEDKLLVNEKCLQRWREHFDKLLNRPPPKDASSTTVDTERAVYSPHRRAKCVRNQGSSA